MKQFINSSFISVIVLMFGLISGCDDPGTIIEEISPEEGLRLQLMNGVWVTQNQNEFFVFDEYYKFKEDGNLEIHIIYFDLFSITTDVTQSWELYDDNLIIHPDRNSPAPSDPAYRIFIENDILTSSDDSLYFINKNEEQFQIIIDEYTAEFLASREEIAGIWNIEYGDPYLFERYLGPENFELNTTWEFTLEPVPVHTSYFGSWFGKLKINGENTRFAWRKYVNPYSGNERIGFGDFGVEILSVSDSRLELGYGRTPHIILVK